MRKSMQMSQGSRSTSPKKIYYKGDPSMNIIDQEDRNKFDSTPKALYQRKPIVKSPTLQSSMGATITDSDVSLMNATGTIQSFLTKKNNKLPEIRQSRNTVVHQCKTEMSNAGFRTNLLYNIASESKLTYSHDSLTFFKAKMNKSQAKFQKPLPT